MGRAQAATSTRDTRIPLPRAEALVGIIQDGEAGMDNKYGGEHSVSVLYAYCIVLLYYTNYTRGQGDLGQRAPQR